MLIGLTGRNASGKSTIVNWFSNKGLKTSSCSDSIRAWLAEQDIEPTRDALIEGGRELRRKGGAGVLAEMLLEILDGEDAVVDSIRTPGEVEALRKRDDFILIEVRANTETRWERLQSRLPAPMSWSQKILIPKIFPHASLPMLTGLSTVQRSALMQKLLRMARPIHSF